MDIKKVVGTNVKRIRKLNGIKQSELAVLINMSPQTIANIEQGKHNVKIELLQAISEVFKLPISYLFSGINYDSFDYPSSLEMLKESKKEYSKLQKKYTKLLERIKNLAQQSQKMGEEEYEEEYEDIK
jgi:transcriptional regulator with XRE-family HTH domain